MLYNDRKKYLHAIEKREYILQKVCDIKETFFIGYDNTIYYKAEDQFCYQIGKKGRAFKTLNIDAVLQNPQHEVYYTFRNTEAIVKVLVNQKSIAYRLSNRAFERIYHKSGNFQSLFINR